MATNILTLISNISTIIDTKNIVLILTHPFFSIIGALLGAYLILKEAKEQKVKIKILLLITFISVILGSRIFYFFGPWYSGNPLNFFNIKNLSGLVLYGGFIGGIIGIFAWTKLKKLNTYQYLDIFSLSAPIILLVARLGCFFIREDLGQSTILPWGVINQVGIIVHPSYLYLSLTHVLIFPILLIIKSQQKFKGQIFLTTLIIYTFFRFIIENFRFYPVNYTILNLNFTASQIISIILFISASGLYIYQSKKTQKT